MENDSPPSNLHWVEDITQVSSGTTDTAQSHRNDQSPAQRRTLARVKKKSEFLLSLITNLDTLIYVELCIVYYMDCSLFRLALRLLNQMIFFTPKPAFIRPAPQPRPYIGAIFIPTVICILLHLFTARSEASEVMRGYLHGGIIIDLIGQKGPTSKVHLVALDILLLVLQSFMLAVRVEQERLQTIVMALSKPGLGMADLTTNQSYDAEERGITRDEAATSNEVELQDFPGPSSSGNSTRSVINRDHNLHAQEDDETLDLIWSGMATICDFHIIYNLRKQRQDYSDATTSALQSVRYSAEFAALTANRRIHTASDRIL